MLTIQSPGARGDVAAYPLKKGVRAGRLERFEDGDAGAVHQNSRRTQGLFTDAHRGVPLGGVGDVEGTGDCRSADLAGVLLARRRIDVCEENQCALRDQDAQ